MAPVQPILPVAVDSSRLGRVRRAELRADVPAPIPVSLSSEEGEGTLVSFPAPIKHLDGFGIVYQPPAANTRADFYILWPGASGNNGAANAGDSDNDDSTLSHFVVTGLRKNARKVLSVVLEGHPRPFTIVLVQTDDDSAALSVQFDLPASSSTATPLIAPGQEPVPTPSFAAKSSPQGTPSLFPAGWDGTRVPISAARLNGFLTKIKGYPSFVKLKPEMYQGIEAVETPKDSGYDAWPGGLRAKIVRVLRDHRLDAVGFEARLDNFSDKDFVYDPNALGVRVEASPTDSKGNLATGHPSDELYRARLAEAGGRVVARGSSTVFFVVAMSEEGGSNDLSPRNKFRLVLEAPQPYPSRVATNARPDYSK